ncbi:hypothetical protein QZH41_004714 [Actinostola sp. cb2023]|nr:hypothetical protein QZH41_004714 [Actinostola sp. cb2023]
MASSGALKLNLTNNTDSPRNKTNLGNATLFKNVEVYVHVIFSVILMIVIIVGNLLVMAAYKKNRRLRTGTYTLLVSLALCDFLVGSVSVPMWINMSLRNWQAPALFVTFFMAIDYFTALSSALHLTVICLERWLAISKPFLHLTFTKQQYSITIACVWLVGLFVSALVFVPVVKHNNQTYILVLVIVGFVMPMVIISLVKVYIFKVAQKLIQQEPTASGDSGPGNERRRKVQKERRTAKTLVIITALFFFELLPTYILALVGGFCLRDCIYKMSWNEIRRLMDFAKWIQYSNSGINPFIYAFRDAEMRKTFRRISVRAMTFRRPFSAVINIGSQSENHAANINNSAAIAHI